MEKPTEPDRGEAAAATPVPALNYRPMRRARTGNLPQLCLSIFVGTIVLFIGLGFAGLSYYFGWLVHDGWRREPDAGGVVGAVFIVLFLGFLSVLCLAAAWACLVRVPRDYMNGRR